MLTVNGADYRRRIRHQVNGCRPLDQAEAAVDIPSGRQHVDARVHHDGINLLRRQGAVDIEHQCCERSGVRRCRRGAEEIRETVWFVI